MTNITTKNNLPEGMTIERAREIVSGAPSWAVYWITCNEYHYSKLSFPNMTGRHSYLLDDLRTAITSHDELLGNPEKFKVGDFVVRKNIKTHPNLWKIMGISNVFVNNFVCKSQGELLHHFHKDELLHATPAEIAVGHRIDGEVSNG